MKRFIVFFLALSLTFVFLCFSLSASALSSDPSYTKEAISHFNKQYNTIALSNFGIFPRSLTGENTKLNGFYPCFIAQESRGYIFFGRTVVFDASDGLLTINLYNAFSYSFSSAAAVDVSDIKVPDSLIKNISFTYSYESGSVRDQFGYKSFFLYLPTSDDIESQTGFTVYNSFDFPVEGDFPVPESESSEIDITYDPVLSTDNNLEFSSYDAYSYDEGEFSNAIDIEGVISELDPDIGDAKGGFHKLFEYLTSSLRIGPVIMVLLTVAFAFYVLGRL